MGQTDIQGLVFSHLVKLKANPPLFSMSKNAKWISWIEAEFDNQCGDTQNITLAEFTKVMGSKVSSS